MRFPDLGADEVLDRVGARWDLDQPVPVPIGDWLACPVCRTPEPQPRYWLFLDRSGHAIAYRCDIGFKCTDCSAVWVHGLAIPERVFRPWRKRVGKRIDWREAKQRLEEAACHPE